MRNTLVVTMCALVGLVAMGGCASAPPVTPHSLRAAQGTGLVREYLVPSSHVWKEVLTVFSGLKLRCIDENKQGGYLLAESDLAIIGKGELVIVFIETQEETKSTRVEVISKQVTPLGFFGSAERNWALDILTQLDDQLKHSSGH